MARIYNKLQERSFDISDRERPGAVSHSMHESRDASIERHDLHQEIDTTLLLNPMSLRAPHPRPGYVQRWIADGFGMAEESRVREHQRFLNKLRQGWSPRDPSTVSDAERKLYLSSRSGSPDDLIRVAGLVLCEMPVHVAQQRLLALNDKTQRQRETLPQSTEQLRQNLRGARGVGDLQVTSESTTFTGKPPATMVD